MFGDCFFNAPLQKSLDLHSKYIKAPAYAYVFSFKGKESLAERLHLPVSEWGTTETICICKLLIHFYLNIKYFPLTLYIFSRSNARRGWTLFI